MSFQARLAEWQDANPDRDMILITATISRDQHQLLSTLIAANKKADKCTVILTTRGGDPDAGFRMARCLRHHYSHVRLVVPSLCKSAGTLIAIAADELAIGDLGELGPLDIQVRKGSELEENSSGLDIMQALSALTSHTRTAFHQMLKETRSMGLSTKLCAEFAAQISSAVAAPLFSQIDPVRLGEMQRKTRIAYEYGNRLDSYTHNLKDNALDRLVSEYPSHSFVIDRKEAKELFHRVYSLESEEMAFCDAIWHAVGRVQEYEPYLLRPDPPAAPIPPAPPTDEQDDQDPPAAPDAQDAGT